MKRFTGVMILFSVLLAALLGWLAAQTIRSLDQEEKAEFRYFGEALFDRLEEEMAVLLQREEERPVEDYAKSSGGSPSPLGKPPKESYILGYLQVEVAGTPRLPGGEEGEAAARLLHAALEFQRSAIFGKAPAQEPAAGEQIKKAAKADSGDTTLASKYFRVAPRQQRYLEQKKEPRLLASQEAAQGPMPRMSNAAQDEIAGFQEKGKARPEASCDARPEEMRPWVAPMEAFPLHGGMLFLFRRVGYVQGVVVQGLLLDLERFLEYLEQSGFAGEPMAAFARLELTADTPKGKLTRHHGAGAPNRADLERRFPRPFEFLQARLTAGQLPVSPGRALLNKVLPAMGVVFFLGLFLIYRSARAIHELSLRRSGFVSSVTHELKTPLTNIRLYADMLREGVAVAPEKQQRYLQVIADESARLTRLINRVLEYSRLENQSRVFDLRPQNLLEVATEVKEMMGEQLNREGFTLHIEVPAGLEAVCDREAVIRILVNCLENSIKFGREEKLREIVIGAEKKTGAIILEITDTGPGLPPLQMKKVFDDFYRGDDSLTRKTSGTGIGLALVRKLAQGMGGTVEARNNPHHGCTIRLVLPNREESDKEK